ncbi:MAG: DMT family transporter [Jatrophihabitantaceae bacterium]
MVTVRPSLAAAVRRRAGLLAVSGGALLWGTTGVPVAIIHERTGLSAVPIGCLRLVIAALAVATLSGRRGWQRARALVARHRWWLVAAGAGLGSYQALYFLGVQYVGVTVSTLVSLAVAPIALTAWGAIVRRTLPGVFALLTLAAAIGGLVLVSLRPGSAADGAHPLLGLVASLAAGLGYAASTLVNHRIAGDGDAVLLTGVTSGIGAVVLVPFAAITGLWWPADAIASGWLVYIGIVTTVAAYGLFFLGLQSTTSETAGVLTLLEPLAAAVLAAIVLHERLTAPGVVGAALMLVAIAGLYARVPEPDASPR